MDRDSIGDGGISDKAKAFVPLLPDTLSYNARNMLADFITRSDAQATYIESFLQPEADELVEAGYLVPLSRSVMVEGKPAYCYAYTSKIFSMRP